MDTFFSVPAQSHRIVLANMQDELNDIVNKTCRGVAACRAVELLKNSNHAIVRDELSIHLAGPAYIERIRKRWCAIAAKL